MFFTLFESCILYASTVMFCLHPLSIISRSAEGAENKAFKNKRTSPSRCLSRARMPARSTASGIHSLSVAATAAAVACTAAEEAASRKGAGAKEASLEASEGMTCCSE